MYIMMQSIHICLNCVSSKVQGFRRGFWGNLFNTWRRGGMGSQDRLSIYIPWGLGVCFFFFPPFFSFLKKTYPLLHNTSHRVEFTCVCNSCENTSKGQSILCFVILNVITTCVYHLLLLLLVEVSFWYHSMFHDLFAF